MPNPHVFTGEPIILSCSIASYRNEFMFFFGTLGRIVMGNYNCEKTFKIGIYFNN